MSGTPRRRKNRIVRGDIFTLQHRLSQQLHKKTAPEIIRFAVSGLFLSVVNLLARNDLHGRIDLPKRSFFCVQLLAPALAHLVSRDKLLHHLSAPFGFPV